MRKTTWKEVHLTNEDDIYRLRANLRSPEYKRYTTNFEEGVGIIETNMPWSMFRNWFRFTGVKMPRDILTSDMSTAEMYPEEQIMTTDKKQPQPENEQVTLTALKAFANGEDVSWHVQEQLREKGFVRAVDIADNALTDLGRTVLAQASDQQPVPTAAAGKEADMFTNRPLYNLVKVLTGEGKWAEAIKVVRQHYPVGLAVARDFVDSIKDNGQFPVKLQVERLQAELAATRTAADISERGWVDLADALGVTYEETTHQQMVERVKALMTPQGDQQSASGEGSE